LQILLGALVAGIDAGRSYTDWPLMGGQFIPPNPLMIEPVWRNFFENPGLVQFIHRMAGYLLLGFTIMIFFKARKSANSKTKSAFSSAVYVLFFQIVLGVYTVVTAAPWEIAILHQATAALLWVLIIRARFMAQYPRASSIREG
jgi:cytochrome c oxidase assembly protein subunit 15